MQVFHSVADVRAQVRTWRRDGLKVGLVPTMGNLHDGHLALVREIAPHVDRIVVSIFVNPIQFGENEDFDAYPRTLEADCAALGNTPADAVFAPGVAEMYPGGLPMLTQVQLPCLGGELCGASRPGHFTGVATVVAKLFNQVEPDVAIFGKKDYQQLLVIRTMAAELDFPVNILGAETRREADGLAMSSRNQYLSAEERARAPRLYAVLGEIAEALRQGRRDYNVLESNAAVQLSTAGFEPDYVSIRRRADLATPEAGDSALVVLAAARLGKARLIDNLEV